MANSKFEERRSERKEKKERNAAKDKKSSS